MQILQGQYYQPRQTPGFQQILGAGLSALGNSASLYAGIANSAARLDQSASDTAFKSYLNEQARMDAQEQEVRRRFEGDRARLDNLYYKNQALDQNLFMHNNPSGNALLSAETSLQNTADRNELEKTLFGQISGSQQAAIDAGKLRSGEADARNNAAINSNEKISAAKLQYDENQIKLEQANSLREAEVFNNYLQNPTPEGRAEVLKIGGSLELKRLDDIRNNGGTDISGTNQKKAVDFNTIISNTSTAFNGNTVEDELGFIKSSNRADYVNATNSPKEFREGLSASDINARGQAWDSAMKTAIAPKEEEAKRLAQKKKIEESAQ